MNKHQTLALLKTFFESFEATPPAQSIVDRLLEVEVKDKPLPISPEFMEDVRLAMEKMESGEKLDDHQIEIIDIVKKLVDNDPLTQEEIGIMSGSSRQNIKNIEKRAMGKLGKSSKVLSLKRELDDPLDGEDSMHSGEYGEDGMK